ncbi:MAG: TIM barrel protein [Gammaproteobacteria bacterium]|nr:TIM barrel protein [Gammaproteobacteria bacterium]MYF31124.1 TIM barrel protein [Gammaproteobacteria bacterium]MYK45401.1 TIM barrel protein [Gammaproteobacteria bacterium]
MPRFAANVSTMFPDLPVAERFGAARAIGFEAVEYLFPYAEGPGEIRRRLRETGVRMILLNTPLGDASAGERGLAAVPGRQADFKDHFEQALCYARTLDVPMIHVMAGVVADEQRNDAEVLFAENIRHAADAAATHGIRILLEPLNDEDTPGYFLTLTAETRRLIQAIGRDNVRMQYDLYHRQIMEGNLARGIADNLDLIAHIQFSSVPGRHEPQFGEVNLPYLFDVCDRLGYDGWIGCEYRPMTTVAEGLGWGRPYGLGPNP